MIEDCERYFRNVKCRYFPCHSGIDPANFNCLFCFCPLYEIINCGGCYTFTKEGKKSCLKCVYPHKAENYDQIIEKLGCLLKEWHLSKDGVKI